jgi:hypothetical protein
VIGLAGDSILVLKRLSILILHMIQTLSIIIILSTKVLAPSWSNHVVLLLNKLSWG